MEEGVAESLVRYHEKYMLLALMKWANHKAVGAPEMIAFNFIIQITMPFTCLLLREGWETTSKTSHICHLLSEGTLQMDSKLPSNWREEGNVKGAKSPG